MRITAAVTVRDQWYPVPLPAVLGHEGAGVVDEVGAFGCGIQTGAGAVLNVLRPRAGTAIAVFGTGSVGLAAVPAPASPGAKAIACRRCSCRG